MATADPADALYEAVGRFLREHRLGYAPECYAFAWQLVSEPNGPLAAAVAQLTDGGVRLSGRDLDELGAARPVRSDTAEQADALMAQTRSQIDDFSGLLDRMRNEATDFGRDLATSADRLADPASDVVAVTAAMLARVRASEARLDAVTSEAADLRSALAEARVDARVDALTGLPNRRALTETFAKAAAGPTPGCLAICDVDHFKQVNDRFGHGAGDRVLRAIARTLADACPQAFVARYGGEEFALLIESDDPAKAVELLDRARATIAAKRFRLREGDAMLGQLTISAGVIRIDAGEAFDTALGRADALLYRAKHAGRNCVEG